MAAPVSPHLWSVSHLARAGWGDNKSWGSNLELAIISCWGMGAYLRTRTCLAPHSFLNLEPVSGIGAPQWLVVDAHKTAHHNGADRRRSQKHFSASKLAVDMMNHVHLHNCICIVHGRASKQLWIHVYIYIVLHRERERCQCMCDKV